VINNDVTRHDRLTTVLLRVFDAFFTKTLDGLAEYLDRFRAGIALTLFFNEFLNFAGNYQNIRHGVSPSRINNLIKGAVVLAPCCYLNVLGLNQAVDFGGEADILLRDGILRMRIECQSHEVVFHKDVGMVISGFSDSRNVIDEIHGLHEILELVFFSQSFHLQSNKTAVGTNV
jgi:hypothetical protein